MPDATPPEGPPPAPPALSAAERRELRARAHALDPVVRVGETGATDAVVGETDRALTAHGLIKVQIFGDDRAAREAVARTLVDRLGCALVQAIGKRVVLWRPREADARPPRRAPIRRAVGTVPKKLAAQGKTAPPRRPRIPLERSEAVTSKAPPRRRAGPGMRTARGALDVTAAPHGSAPAPAPVRPKTPRTRTSKASADAARTGGGSARGTGARQAATDATATRPRSPARGGPGRKPAAARAPAPSVRGARAADRRTGAAGSGAAPAGRRTGAAASTARGKPQGRPADAGTRSAPPARGRSAGPGDKTGARKAAASPARPPAGSGRRGPGSNGTVTGSGRPAPRTRAVRRGR